MQEDSTIMNEPSQIESADSHARWPLTCSIQEASDITGLSYDYLNGQSKIANPRDRLPGFKVGKSTFRVLVDEIPDWLRRKAEIA